MTTPKIAGLLGAVDDLTAMLARLEASFEEEKARISNELASYVSSMAKLSDSQALRASVVRELYWNRNVSAAIIGDAFKVRPNVVSKLAGKVTREVTCAANCGRTFQKTFSSRLELEGWNRDARNRRMSAVSLWRLCQECQAAQKRAGEEAASQRNIARRKRNEELRSMTWDQFVETEEWIGHRNSMLATVGYECQLCGAGEVSLYVFLHVGTPQDFPSGFSYSDGYDYDVICADCIPRCEGLIDRERGERVPKEWLPKLRDEARGGGRYAYQ